MEKEEKNKNNTNETVQVEENKKTNEKANNKKEQKRKNSKLRMMLVILFLLVFSGVSYVQLRGSYLEYLELGSQYIDIFKKCLSGTPGRNLIDMQFTLDAYGDKQPHDFLLELRDSELKDERNKKRIKTIF
mgnify:CR=1 FL=1